MDEHTRDERELHFALGFNRVEGIGAAKLRALLDYFGSLEAAWWGSRYQLEQLGLDRRAIANLFKWRDKLDVGAEYERVRAAGVDLLTWHDAGYPSRLATIAFPPPLLFMRGELQAADQRAIAVVGTRRLTSYGRQVARELTRELVACGLTIVSGLARGIDSVVHACALEYGGRTIAVLGSGVDIIYPPENRPLVERMVRDQQGAVLSEYPLGTRPTAKNFPPRNRIVSGMTWGTIVIEGDVKSGAMITAKFALEQDREVFAVPGPIYSPSSRGPNWLIQQGAKLVCGIEDIVDELTLGLGHGQNEPPTQLVLPESAEEAALLPHLSRQPRHIDELCRASGLPSSVVGSTLTLLELRGVVQQHEPLVYVLFGAKAG